MSAVPKLPGKARPCVGRPCISIIWLRRGPAFLPYLRHSASKTISSTSWLRATSQVVMQRLMQDIQNQGRNCDVFSSAD